MMTINNYNLDSELSNANSGFSKWAFAHKDGKEYFIKELLNPVYPTDRGAMPEALFEERRRFCNEFEKKYAKFYAAINNVSRGNLVRILDFFRSGTKYYIVTEKVSEKSLPMTVISSIPLEDKYLLLKSIAFAFFCLHSADIVHFDVKPTNIFVKRTKTGHYVGKLIDFDAGFFVDSKPEDTELGGDLTYLAPETFLAIAGEDSKITTKTDIFSLGLVFHEYFASSLPGFNESEYEYPYEAVLSGEPLHINTVLIPPELHDTINRMLDVNPDVRPSCEEILDILEKITGSPVYYASSPAAPNVSPRLVNTTTAGSSSASIPDTSASTAAIYETAAKVAAAASASTPAEPSKKADDWFEFAGDL